MWLRGGGVRLGSYLGTAATAVIKTPSKYRKQLDFLYKNPSNYRKQLDLIT